MLFMVLAFALGVAAGFILPFPGFAILWVAGLIGSAIVFGVSGWTFGQVLWLIVGMGVVAQVGFFVSALLRVTFWPQSEQPDAGDGEAIWNRLRRASKSRSAPRQQL